MNLMLVAYFKEGVHRRHSTKNGLFIGKYHPLLGQNMGFLSVFINTDRKDVDGPLWIYPITHMDLFLMRVYIGS